MEEDVAYWVQLAQLDLDSAEKSLAGDSFLHCLFGCQQALEKLLKARVVQSTRQMPPRVHNLIRLANLANLTLAEEQETLLSQLSLQYIELRYPEEIEAIEELNNRSAANSHLQRTQEFFRWLEAQTK